VANELESVLERAMRRTNKFKISDFFTEFSNLYQQLCLIVCVRDSINR
uniref:Uncharacterized protein n=1 Tax=Amphimedon queenslandica TaxID=400682 RepID=A0A1X7UU75_AMPQE